MLPNPILTIPYFKTTTPGCPGTIHGKQHYSELSTFLGDRISGAEDQRGGATTEGQHYDVSSDRLPHYRTHWEQGWRHIRDKGQLTIAHTVVTLWGCSNYVLCHALSRKTDTPVCKRDSGRIVLRSGNYFNLWSGNESVCRVL